MSLEGLSSLIQLESTRLEGFKQTTQNIQQVNGAVQQIGVQVAQNKISVWKDRIGTECDKEIQQAAVKKAESKLARERKAENMAAMIVQGVTLLSAASNVWNAASDLMGKQKLGDIPDYLKTSPIDPKGPNSMAFSTPQDANGNSSVYAIGKNEDGSETVLSMQRDIKNGMTSPKAATVSFYDINTILAGNNDFDRLKTDLGSMKSFADAKAKYPNLTEANFNTFKSTGQASFSLLAQTAPDLASKVMQDKGHGMSRDESKNFVETLDKFMPHSSTKLEHTSSDTEDTIIPPTKTDAEKLAQLQALLSLVPPDQQLARMESIIKDDKNKDIKIGDKPISSMKAAELLEQVNKLTKPDTSKADPSKPATDTQAPVATSSFNADTYTAPKEYAFNVSKKEDGSADVTLYDTDKKMTLTVNFPKGEPKINGKVMPFEDIFKGKNSEALDTFMGKIKSPGQEIKDFDPKKYTMPKNSSFDSKINKDGTTTVTMNDKDKKMLVTINFDKDDPLLKGKSFDALFDNTSAPLDAIEAKMKESNPQIKAYNPEIKPQITVIFGKSADGKTNNADSDMVTRAADGKTYNAAIAGLQGSGHLSKDYDSNIAMKGVKGFMGAGKLLTDCVVNTAKDAAPYFQAYLEAKTRADQAQDELTEALTKLAALTKKLKAIQMQLDLFNGKGA